MGDGTDRHRSAGSDRRDPGVFYRLEMDQLVWKFTRRYPVRTRKCKGVYSGCICFAAVGSSKSLVEMAAIVFFWLPVLLSVVGF